jgi:YHS domain-containing protein
MGRLAFYLFDLIATFLVARLIGGAIQQSGGPRVRSWQWRVGREGEPSRGPAPGPDGAIRGQTARDPVCGMFVSTELSHTLKAGRETLHFCSSECRERYQKEQQRAEA